VLGGAGFFFFYLTGRPNLKNFFEFIRRHVNVFN